MTEPRDESDAFHKRLRVYYLRDSHDTDMSDRQNPTAGIIVLVLAGCLVAAWLTRDTAPNRTRRAGRRWWTARLLDTARQVAGLAETQQEVDLAQQAARLADHELDQAFATAVREAASVKPPATGPIQQLNARVARAKAQIAADQARIAKLAKDAAASDRAAAELELAQAQLALDQDELEDAQLDLARQGGDERGKLEQAAQEHAAAQTAARASGAAGPAQHRHPRRRRCPHGGRWATAGRRSRPRARGR